MSALFDAAGYAHARPAVHPRVIDLAAARLGRRFRAALDVGCGAGLSTAPLDRLADRRVGAEPSAAMLAFARGLAPGAEFVAARAEQLPFRPGAFDLVTAAGSLNYMELPAALAEIRRVMAAEARLLVYDFSPGRAMSDSPALDAWFTRFAERYPAPAEGVAIDARRLEGFVVREYTEFRIPLMLDPAFYLEYMLTETSVSAAVRAGVARESIRDWCRAGLAPVFGGRAREVWFEGYFACLEAA